MESNATLTGIQWRKSSYSSDQGGECVECATLGGLSWRKSSYSSDQGGDCVEIAELPGAAVAVRDSKTPTGPVLAFPPAVFTTFVEWAAVAR
ncbi:DUF397 domain-containing protein [Streptomyces gibsoniae]|uniref:DUF397 domain-containing protein n=1 Tax=Streptomyces gibsoniae TaxID=3075529 RepID=A0ABU2TKG6_9ACTN|nr:DUF397 domain-containing protein [Streptomyces sp. DSM 41699]MDT0461430.1 DUF397 domain-containing protein [Streptomyces sp. DSM 41699]